MFCPKCGNQNLDTSKFCRKCGKPLPQRVEPPGQAQMRPAGFRSVYSFVGQVIEGKYRIDEQLGTGGMGDVYRATRVLIGDTVAIKILHPHLARDPQAAERFRREAVMATKLHHRNVVGIYDVGIWAPHNIPYILMEMAEGYTLRQIIQTYKLLPLDFAVTVTTQVCSALEEAHNLGIVHRDIKPENIIANQTTAGWHIKVLDFGIAKLYNQADIGLTQDGNAMGTPQYMSPEQCMGENLDARSDVYSVGIVLYEMLTGTVPFKSPTASAIAIHHVQTTPQAPRLINDEIHPQVEGVVLKSIWKQREHRQQRASQLAQELIQAATVAFKTGFNAVPTAPIPAPDVEPEFIAAEEAGAEADFDIDTVISNPSAADETVELDAARLAEIGLDIAAKQSGPEPEIVPEPVVSDEPASAKSEDFDGEKTLIAHELATEPVLEAEERLPIDASNIAEIAEQIEPSDGIKTEDAAEPAAPKSIEKKPRRTTAKKPAKQRAAKIIADPVVATEPVFEPEIIIDEALQAVFESVAAADTAALEVHETQPRIAAEPDEPPASTDDFDQPVTEPAEDMALVFADAELLLDDLFAEATPPNSARAPITREIEPVEVAPAEEEHIETEPAVEPEPEIEPEIQPAEEARVSEPVAAEVSPAAEDYDQVPSFAAMGSDNSKRKFVVIAAGIGSLLMVLILLASVPILYYYFPGSDGAQQNSNLAVGESQAATTDSANDSVTIPAGMAFVPGGEFTMGSDNTYLEDHQNSKPVHLETVKAFYMDITEVTNEEYKKFIDAEKHSTPPDWTDGTFPAGKARFPVTGVTWDDANDYAKWADKRLPTEAEWEFAARGTTGQKYPWGKRWKPGMENSDRTRAMREVGRSKGKSPFGMVDMAGNAWEWTASDFVQYPGGKLKEEVPGAKVIRGGSYLSDKDLATTSYRFPWLPRGAKSYSETSFRCVKDVVQ